jgi:hypothetical protein
VSKNPIARGLFFITVAIVLVVIGGIVSSYVVFKGTQPLTVMLAVVAAVTYFGLLAMPGGWTESEGFREGRIRLALASTFVMVYLVYLATVIFWTDEPASGNEGTRQVWLFAETMVGTLTDMIKIVLPFYFGVSGAVEIAKSRAKAGDRESGSDVTKT